MANNPYDATVSMNSTPLLKEVYAQPIQKKKKSKRFKKIQKLLEVD